MDIRLSWAKLKAFLYGGAIWNMYPRQWQGTLLCGYIKLFANTKQLIQIEYCLFNTSILHLAISDMRHTRMLYLNALTNVFLLVIFKINYIVFALTHVIKPFHHRGLNLCHIKSDMIILTFGISCSFIHTGYIPLLAVDMWWALIGLASHKAPKGLQIWHPQNKLKHNLLWYH